MKGKPFSLIKRKMKKGSIYYVRFKMPDGSFGTAKSSGCSRKGDAEEWAMEQLRTGKIVVKSKVTLNHFAADFFSWEGEWATDLRITGKRLSERQCKEKTMLLNNRILPYIGDERLVDISKARIKDYRNKLFKEGLSGSTINKVLSCLKSILEEAEDRSLIKAVPKIERVADKPKHRGILTPEEVKILFASEWPDLRGYTASLLAASTGLRLGEIVGLRHDSLKEGYLHIDRSWDITERRLNETTKTGRARFVPIPNLVESHLKELIFQYPYKHAPQQFIFFSIRSDSYPIDGRYITRKLQAQLDYIGIGKEEQKNRNIDFHSWRHFFNSALINARVPIQKVQAITGHLTDEMTSNYYHLDELNDIKSIQNSILN